MMKNIIAENIGMQQLSTKDRSAIRLALSILVDSYTEGIPQVMNFEAAAFLHYNYPTSTTDKEYCRGKYQVASKFASRLGLQNYYISSHNSRYFPLSAVAHFAKVTVLDARITRRAIYIRWHPKQIEGMRSLPMASAPLAAPSCCMTPAW